MINTKSKSYPLFRLKVSESEKYENEGLWFKNYMNYVVPNNSFNVDDYDQMKTAYEVVNNNLSGFKKELREFCEPLGENLGQIEEEVIPYPELYNKVNVLKGELIKRNDNFKVILLTANAIQEKDTQRLNLIKQAVDEKLGILIQNFGDEFTKLSPEEQQNFIDKQTQSLQPKDILAQNWQSDLEIFYNKALKYCYYNQDIKRKGLETFEDVITADRCFVYNGWLHGKPAIELRNPLFCGYLKSPNDWNVNQGSYFWYRRPISITDVYNNYDLTEEEIADLGIGGTTSYPAADKRHSIGKDARPVYSGENAELALSLSSKPDDQVGTHQSNSGLNGKTNQYIWETHFEFKAWKETIFLSTINEYNQTETTIMSSKFEIPSHAVKEKYLNMYGKRATRYRWMDEIMGKEYTAEIIWIPRKYEIVKLGNSVYPIFQEVPYQHTSVENPFEQPLSTSGCIFTSRNAKSVSLVQRALAPYFQYIYVKHILNRELAKFKGSTLDIDVDQIPDNLGQDINGNEIRDKFATWLVYLKKTGINFYSGTQTSAGGLPPATRSPGSKGTSFGTAMELFNLQQMLELLRKEIGLAMGISPQREAMYSNGSNVSDNQQALMQSYSITEPYFYIHSLVWKSAIELWLSNFRAYCKHQFTIAPVLKDISFNFFLPDGTQELLRVTPDMLSATDIGLFVSNGGDQQSYLQAMTSFAQAFAQNRGEGMTAISTLLKAISSGSSPEEVHKMIVMEEQKQQARQDEIAKQQAAAQEKLAQMQIDAREDVQNHEKDLTVLKAEEDRETKLAVAAVGATSWDEEKDRNDNGIADAVDIANHYLKEKEFDLKVQQFEHDKVVDIKKLNKPSGGK